MPSADGTHLPSFFSACFCDVEQSGAVLVLQVISLLYEFLLKARGSTLRPYNCDIVRGMFAHIFSSALRSPASCPIKCVGPTRKSVAPCGSLMPGASTLQARLRKPRAPIPRHGTPWRKAIRGEKVGSPCGYGQKAGPASDPT